MFYKYYHFSIILLFKATLSWIGEKRLVEYHIPWWSICCVEGIVLIAVKDRKILKHEQFLHTVYA